MPRMRARLARPEICPVDRGIVLLLALALAWGAPALAQDGEDGAPAETPVVAGEVSANGEALWETTRRLYRATARRIVPTKTPLEEQSKVTEETLEQLAKLQKRAARDGQHPKRSSWVLPLDFRQELPQEQELILVLRAIGVSLGLDDRL